MSKNTWRACMFGIATVCLFFAIHKTFTSSDGMGWFLASIGLFREFICCLKRYISGVIDETIK